MSTQQLSWKALFPALSLVLVIAFSPLGPASGTAEDSGGATGVVADFGDRALKMLNDSGAAQEDRQKQFHALLDQDFDFATVSRFVLGRYWQAASEDQRRDFTAAFEDFVVQSYSKRFNEFTGTSFAVTGQRGEGSDTIIHTDVVRRDGGQPAKVDWRVAKEGDGYKITEVSVDGVSMSLTHRQEFASIMERNGGNVADLIAQLRAKTGGAPTPQ
jgi:phospholipid transport system substrate-binding protein